MRDIMYLLQELEQEIKASKKSVMGNRIINDIRVLELIEEMKESIPGAVKEANTLLRDRELVEEKARRQAEEILKNARERADMMVTNSAIVKQAAHDADEIVRDAVSYRDNVIADTKEALSEIFKDAELNLMGILRQITEASDMMKDELDSQIRGADGQSSERR